MRRLHRAIAAALCGCLCLGLAGCTGSNITFEDIAPQTPVVPVSEREVVDISAVEYQPFDRDAYLAQIEAARALLADDGNEQAVIDAYYALVEGLKECLTAYKYSEIQYYLDYENDELLDANSSAFEVANDCSDALCVLLSDILDSAYRQTYIDEVGSERALMYENYEAMTDEQKALDAREKALQDEYTRLAGADYDSYTATADVMAPIYLELVDVRRQIAASYGYDNYLDYAYENVYCRSYTPQQARDLEEAVKDCGLAQLYINSMLYQTEEDYEAPYRYPDADEDSLLALMRRYMPLMDEGLGDALEYMLACGAYDIGYDPGKYDASFTTMLEGYGVPYLFSQPDPDSQFYSLDTLVHEFGHYHAYLIDPTYATPDGFVYSLDQIDVAEINSTALELLFTHYYPELYGEDADTLRASVLSDILSNIVFGCLFDEFQQAIYTAEDLQAEDISEIFHTIMLDYMGDIFIDDYSYSLWALVNHNFDAPLYYISYGVSALAAFQLWEAGEEDFEGALQQYLELTAHGTDVDFLQLLKDCGMQDIFEESYLEGLYDTLRGALL